MACWPRHKNPRCFHRARESSHGLPRFGAKPPVGRQKALVAPLPDYLRRVPMLGSRFDNGCANCGSVEARRSPAGRRRRSTRHHRRRFARTLTTKTRTARNRHAMIGEISPPHSLTFNKAKQKRTLVKTPVHGSYSQPRPAKGSLGYRAVRPVGSANNRGWLLSQPLRQLASNGRMDTNFVLPRRTSDQVAIIVTEVGTGVGSSNAHPCVRAGEDTVFRLACLTR